MNKEDKQAITKVFKIWALIGAVFKSMFEAFVQIVWGLASVMFLNVLLLYLHINQMLDQIPMTVLHQFYLIFEFILEYWGLLFMLLTIFYCYVNLKEINRK